jgi:glucan phosphoethanolaminetransferase (alkaline phosphatase superfamily)
MSIDRYLNMVHETWYRRYRKPKYAGIVCLLIWTGKEILSFFHKINSVFFIVSLLFMFPYTHFFNINNEKNNQSAVVLDCIVHDKNSLFSSCIFTFGFYYVLPLSIIVLCYLRVFMHVRRTGYQVVKCFVSLCLNILIFA